MSDLYSHTRWLYSHTTKLNMHTKDIISYSITLTLEEVLKSM